MHGTHALRLSFGIIIFMTRNVRINETAVNDAREKNRENKSINVQKRRCLLKKKKVQTYRRYLTVSHGANRIFIVIIRQILKN